MPVLETLLFVPWIKDFGSWFSDGFLEPRGVTTNVCYASFFFLKFDTINLGLG